MAGAADRQPDCGRVTVSDLRPQVNPAGVNRGDFLQQPRQGIEETRAVQLDCRCVGNMIRTINATGKIGLLNGRLLNAWPGS